MNVTVKRILVVVLALSAIVLLSAENNAERATELRKSGQLGKAERLLKRYSSPTNFDSLNPEEKLEFLHGLLELAHIRALKEDVPPIKIPKSDFVARGNPGLGSVERILDYSIQ